MVELNLLGLLSCTHADLPHLPAAVAGKRRRVADVVDMSSVAGRVVRLHSGVYNSTKFGVGAFSGSLLRSEDIVEAVRQSVTQPRHVSVNEVMVWSTGQER